MSDTNAALLGGKEIEVLLRDGKRETVFVRELPIRLFGKFLEAQDDEALLAELFTSKPPEWVDKLTVASHEIIVEEGGELNFPLVTRWVERKAVAIEKLKPSAKKLAALATSPTL
jgi:hypothetical protein